MFGWAAGPPSLQGNASLSHQKIPFPTQSDGRKVKSPVMPRATKATEQGPVCWVGTAKGGGCRGRRHSEEPRPCILGGTYRVLIAALHATARKCGFGDGTGLGGVTGASFLFIRLVS